MKNLKLVRVAFFLLTIPFVAACGGASPSTPASIPISIEGADGITGISVNSTFSYEFSAAVDQGDIESNYFIVPTPASGISADISAKAVTTKVTLNSDICKVANAIEATYTFYSDTVVGLDPTEVLPYNTDITACVVSESYMATFQTEATSGDPSVALVLDSSGKMIDESGSTDVMGGSYTVVYSEAMDDTSAGLVDNYSISSGSVIGAPDSISTVASGRVYTVSIPSDYYFQLSSTDLSISGVSSSGGVEIPASSYLFNLGCAVSDDFIVDSQGCWQVNDDSSYTWTTWDDILANALTFDTDNGRLTYQQSSGSFVIYKEAVISSSGFEFEFYVELSGIVPDSQAVFFLGITDTLDLYDLISGSIDGKAIMIGFSFNDVRNVWECEAGYVGGNATNVNDFNCNTAESGRFKVSLDASSANYQYALNGASYGDFPPDSTFPANVFDFLDDFGENAYMFLMMSYQGATEIEEYIQKVTAESGITVEGQY